MSHANASGHCHVIVCYNKLRIVALFLYFSVLFYVFFILPLLLFMFYFDRPPSNALMPRLLCNPALDQRIKLQNVKYFPQTKNELRFCLIKAICLHLSFLSFEPQWLVQTRIQIIWDFLQDMRNSSKLH